MSENEGDNVLHSEHVFSEPNTLVHEDEMNDSTDLDVETNEIMLTKENGTSIVEPEEEVFGVVDPVSILNAVPIVGRRGRKGAKQSEDSESDEAYSEADSEETESDSDSEIDSEEEYSDDDEEDDEYDDDDGEEYGRNRIRRPNYYQHSQRPIKPQLPPVLAAITEKMFQQKQQINSDNVQAGASSSGSNLTAAQFQEMARNAVSSLAASSRGPSDRALPVLLPRTPQATENIRENVSQELKQSIASMLMNPELRAALIAKLQANKASAAAPIQQRPQYSNKLSNFDGPSQTVTSTRARRSTKSVDYSNFFKDDAFEESSPESTPKDSPQGLKKVRLNSIPPTPSGKRRGRPPKSESHDTRSKAVEVKVKNRHKYDENSDEEYDELDDGDNISNADSESEPGIEKILSHRKTGGKDEFFVKFHNLAYIHADWIGRDEIVAESGGASRVSRFLSKPLSYYHFDDKNIYNPEFNMIDRIVYGWKHPDPDDEKKMVTSYLIKWCALPLDQTTWEKESTVKGFNDGPDAIKRYESIPDPWNKRENALAVGRRPDASQWSRLDASPIYKSDNSLRPYQLEGLNWLVYCWMHKQSCIIADEMGLGKTVQTVSFLDMIYNRFNVRGPFLVVAPLSTLPHWQREFAAWTDLRVLLYHGTEASRDVMFEYEFFYKDPRTDQIIPGLCKFDVILTTYEMTLSGQHHLRNIIWRVGVFDEAHRLKNKVSKAAEVLQTFQIEHKVLLTGTPIQNSLDELFALLNFLQPHRFYSAEVFLKEYGNLRRSEDVERLQALLKPLMLRRLKEDVEKSIPVKEETIIEVELTNIQKRYYRAILERNFGFLMKGAKANNMPNLINTMMELRKCCIHPYLIKGAEDRILSENAIINDFEAQMNCMVQSSGKLVLVDKLLKKLREGGHKVLIFSQMTRCLDILSDFLRWRGYPVERIDGAIRGDERQASIDRYCDPNSDSFVFLLCTKAGGVGINLTAADTVVIFDSDWNPQNDLQAQARCHRIGQTKSVKIYRLITRNTYEREMFDRAGMKLGLDKAILQKMGPESSGIDDLTESSATPQLSKAQVEDLLKKGAYGILMENDDAGMKFMDEDIDSILERRTTVIKHDNGTKNESHSAMDGSIFSKASFAATADDLDLDLDDPNFWELWAKKMNVDPSHIQSSGVAVDDSRIRRVIRRLLSHSKDDYGKVLSEFPCTLTPNDANDSESDVTLWSEEERSGFVRLLLRFGLCSFDRLRPYFPHRSQNDLIAATKIILKTCIECVSEDEPKFKEDSEKLLLSKIEFERLDKKTARQAAAEGDEEGSGVPLSAGEFAKSDIPYSGASRKQILEFRSFFKDENCPESFRELVHSRAYEILMILQVVELLRKILEEVGGSNITETEAFESLAGLSIPNSAGSGPASWWDRDEDLALLIGTIRYGFGEFEAIKEDSSLAWMHQLQKEGGGVEFPDSEKVFERIFKLVIAIEKRNRASAKLAMHSMTLSGSRRRGGFEEEGLISISRRHGRSRRRRGEDDEEGEDDEDDEEYVTPMEEKRSRGRGRPKRRQTFSTPVARFIASWSKPQRAEFNRLIYSSGVPQIIGEESYDWTIFRELMRSKGSSGSDDLADEKEVVKDASDENGVEGDNSLLGKSDEELNKYMVIYLNSCKYSADRPSRRRGRPSKNGKIVDEDEDEDDFGDDREDEEDAPDSIIEMAPERAKKSLSRIELFSKMRSEEICNHPNMSEILQDARRSSGLPRWWIIGEHDEALLKGAIEFGFGRPDLLIKNVKKFKEIYDQIESGDLNVRESRRKTAVISDILSSTNDSSSISNYPVVDGIDPNKLSWPNELIILRRLELIVELLADHEVSTKKSPAKAKKEKARKGNVSDSEEPTKKSKVTASSKTGSNKKSNAPKTKKQEAPVKNPPTSPTRRRANNTSVETDPIVDDFPPIQFGRPKRQKTLTDFGFSKK